MPRTSPSTPEPSIQHAEPLTARDGAVRANLEDIA